MNGQRLTAPPIDAIDAMLALAAGSLDEAHFAAWIKTHLRAAGGSSG
jgi:prophage maintenance system killer protein